MTRQATTQKSEGRSKKRNAVIASLALGAALGAMVTLAGTAREAYATFPGENGRIAFASNRTTGEGVNIPEKGIEIFSINLDGTGLEQLTHNVARDFQPDFSPDGGKCSSVSDRDFSPGIYTMNADGTNQKKRSRGPAMVFATPGFSPDGSKIAFHTNRDGNFEIYEMRTDGTGQVNLTNNPAADFTPDSQPLKSQY